MIINDIKDIVSVYGNFAPLQGAPEKTEEGFYFKGEKIEFISEIKRHPSGVISRRDRLVNISAEPVTITSAASRFIFNGGEHEVYTQHSEWTCESEGLWTPLNQEIGATGTGARFNDGAVPFVCLWNLQTQRGYAFHIMAKSMWKYRVYKLFEQQVRKDIAVELGFDDRDLNYSLAPEEILELPEILYYPIKNKVDLDAYKLHRYCNDIYPQKAFPIIYNTWMSKFDVFSFEELSQQLEKAKYIGADTFVIDAGWFGLPITWFDNVGLWKEHPKALDMRLEEFANKVHSEGLKLGLWFEIERAGKNSDIVKEYPQHYIKEGEQYFINFAKKETCDYIYDMLVYNIRKYKVDHIKFDFNAYYTYDRDRTAFIDYFRGYEYFIGKIYSEFPEIYIENCASGGMRMAMATLPLSSGFWMSDNHSLYTQLRIYKDTVKRMSSRAIKRYLTVRSHEGFKPVYGTLEPTEKIIMSGDNCWDYLEVVNKDYMLYSVVGAPIGISCDLKQLSQSTLDTIREFIVSYKEDEEFWKNSECHLLTDTESMTVLQFNDRNFKKIKVYTYVNFPHQHNITLYPVCDKEKTYTVNGQEISGSDLWEEGYNVPIGWIRTATQTVFEVKQ